jgi:beta-phosphoglucomutase family hydrolase
MSAYSFDAVIFDLDGVITSTASVHSAAWKQMFDQYLGARAQERGEPFQEFTHSGDYLPYVDGKPRYKGVASFLQSRGIDLPFGDPEDPPSWETICGLGNRKNQIFSGMIAHGRVSVFSTTVELVEKLRENQIRVGVASSSKNARAVLTAVDLLHHFGTCVDGIVSAELGLQGKPEPDIFTTACDKLGVRYDRAVIVEDAVSGVQAGQKGNFGLVVGVAREDNELELRTNGADIVVTDLGQLGLDRIEEWFTRGLEDEAWSLSYHNYAPGSEKHRETLLAVGNGYLGTRGAQEETRAGDISYPGTYIAGVYNRLESEIAGRTVANEDLVNCPNWLPLTFKPEGGEWLDPSKVEILSHTRRLSFRDGVLQRIMVVRDSDGRETRVESRRVASMAQPHLAGLQYCITPLNYSGCITIRSGLDGQIINAGVARYRQLSSAHLDPVAESGAGAGGHIVVRTNQSKIQIVEAAKHSISVNGSRVDADTEVETSPGAWHATFEVEAGAGQPITVEKLVAIYTSNDAGVADPVRAAREALESVRSYDQLLQASADAWAAIWDRIDIAIEGDRWTQKLLRLNLYHSLVAASPHNRGIDAGIPARGLHGEAYRGHIFWDELYILPFYNLHFPETSRAALLYRYRRLEQARAYAKEHGFSGAMFPWQSGSDGSEETQVLHLNPLSGKWGPDYSSLQRHVSLAIAYNVWQYYRVTLDARFLEDYGAELFLEICRFWAGKASFNDELGRYQIAGVMGPDEYHEMLPGSEVGGLTDNSYTNIMVVWAFHRAFEILDLLSPGARQRVVEQITLAEDELGRWRDISQRIRIAISGDGVLEQFDGYFGLKELDWDGYRARYGNIGRMDRLLKAEGSSPDEYQVAKQADALMAFYNLGQGGVADILSSVGYPTADDLLRVNLDYYLQRTSHGSTLSRLVHAYLANLTGDRELSWRLYQEALESDYVDIQGGTTGEGIHTGVMTGTAFMALRSYVGLALDGELLEISPSLPTGWRQVRFNIGFRGDRFFVSVTPDRVKVRVASDRAKPVAILVHGQKVSLAPQVWVTVRLAGGA